MKNQTKRNFASDNNSGIHAEVLRAIAAANEGHVVAYGADAYTENAMAKFKKTFGAEVEAFFVFNGTGANVLCLKAMTDSFNAILCSDLAHIYLDECGAPEKFTGCKLLPIKTPDGKLNAKVIEEHLHGLNDQHHVQPKVISITQATEVGTVYTPEEVSALSEFARQRNMYLHMDGARLCNAAASLGISLKKLTSECGVHAVSFGGTKNGLMGAEAVLVFDKALAENFKYLRKQSMQLASKMRFIATQFDAFLTDDLWLRNANASNGMAQLLASQLKAIPEIEITQKVQSNGVFAKIPKDIIQKLLQHTFFYTWQGHESDRPEVRLMCSFDTTEEDVLGFVNVVRELI